MGEETDLSTQHIARLKHDRGVAGVTQVLGCTQPREPRADNYHALRPKSKS